MDMIARRDFLSTVGLGGVAVLSGCTQGAAAAYPTRDVTFIIPFAPGGGFDSYVRILLGPMQQALKHKANVLPLNVEGAGGGKAASQLFHAAPDGYTISVISIPGAIVLQLLQGGSGFELDKMTWLGNMGRDAYGIAVGIDSPIKSVADLKALSARRPVKFTSTGPGSTGRAGTLISSNMLGINAQIIAGYKGTSEYLVAAARGDGDAAVCSLSSMYNLAAAKVIRIVASFEEHSSIAGVHEDATTLGQPDLTKIAQFRPVAAPPGLPQTIQKTLSNALHTAVDDPSVKAWSQKNGANLDWLSPADTVAMLRDQQAFIRHWKHVLGDKL